MHLKGDETWQKKFLKVKKDSDKIFAQVNESSKQMNPILI